MDIYVSSITCGRDVYPHTKIARSDAKADLVTVPTSIVVKPVCRICGRSKNSGKSSCCARGGAWFKKCGDMDDTQFEHTWAEGVQACKGKL